MWGEYTEAGKALMLWHMREAISHISLHSGVPTAENELPGGVYRRQPVNFSEPADGEVRADQTVFFDVPSGVEVAYAGFWTRQTGGVMLARGELLKPERFVTPGVYEVDLAALDLNLDSREG